MAVDQIRTVVRTFRDKLFTEIFPPAEGEPSRTMVPKTLIFAKDDSHADDIVDIVRTEFGKGNDFCQKITYRSVKDSDELIAEFRNSPELRIAVTVDQIATGTDIKPLECLLFMRDVRSRGYFEQMLGPRRAGDQQRRLPRGDARRDLEGAVCGGRRRRRHRARSLRRPNPAA